MNILVTGGAGYLGSVLIPKLLMRRHTVRVIDIGYFGLSHLKSFTPAVEIIRGDIRSIAVDPEFREQALKDIDCIIHLAAISNDPSAELHPDLTDEVNYQSTVSLAEEAKARGIRFVFSSSCSVYGEADGFLTEEGSVNPLTAYAVSKVKSDNALIKMASGDWRPVILRNGTLFGYSPRMRFDLVVNIFSLYSTLHNRISVFGDGMQWRPFLSVQDCARAFVFLAEKTDTKHIIYNISHENLRVVDVADMFKRMNPSVEVIYVPTENPDLRDYRVSAQRMLDEGFKPVLGVEEGAQAMSEAIICGQIHDPESIFYRNAKWLKELTQIGERNHLQVVDLLESFGTSARRHHR
jgi:nucleoside-diphosphate-sugar epimerase